MFSNFSLKTFIHFYIKKTLTKLANLTHENISTETEIHFCIKKLTKLIHEKYMFI